MATKFYGIPKYRARKVTNALGQTFDSKKECDRWEFLHRERIAGRITDLQTQVRIELLPSVYEEIKDERTGKIKKGKCIERAVFYVADFVYKKTETGQMVYEDVKGYKTKDYILKRKMLLALKGIKLIEI